MIPASSLLLVCLTLLLDYSIVYYPKYLCYYDASVTVDRALCVIRKKLEFVC